MGLLGDVGKGRRHRLHWDLAPAVTILLVEICNLIRRQESNHRSESHAPRRRERIHQLPSVEASMEEEAMTAERHKRI